jgi:hypothetical protein
MCVLLPLPLPLLLLLPPLLLLLLLLLPPLLLLLLLLLQYLDGPEVDCDLVLSEGRAVYGAVTDNWPTVSDSSFSKEWFFWFSPLGLQATVCNVRIIGH